ncbi:putative Choline transporter-like protein 2 [Monocercomonoides exilis]|uniref:putative Choline transporter-like protein 2 n=1 Tax=Monocercomonoides exilis TaxID=2049356 RepID=UPI003559E0EB|nr:putative Choline transporter-like protein 2 [Monocercomonoides exilis]
MFHLAMLYNDYGQKESKLPIRENRLDLTLTRQKCNDIGCLAAFCIVAILAVGAFIYGVVCCDFEKFKYPVDRDGNNCGREKGPNKNKPFLFFTNETKNILPWCVAFCPNATHYCICENENPKIVNSPFDCHSDSGRCFSFQNSTFHTENNICMGAHYATAAKSDNPITYFSYFKEKWVLILATGFSIAICSAWILFMTFCARKCIWASIFIVIFLVFGLSVASFVTTIIISSKRIVTGRGFVYIGTIWSLAILTFGIILSCTAKNMKHRIEMTCQLVTETGKAIRSMPCLPLTTCCFSLVEIVVFGAILIGIFSLISTFPQRPVNTTWTLDASPFGVICIIVISCWYLWVQLFLFGVNQMTIGGTIGSWYFSRDKKKDLPRFTILSTIKRIIRYHLGSVAFGSGIITFSTIVNAVASIARSAGRHNSNGVLQLLCACLECISSCFKDIFEFVTSRAYIIIALKGQPFWTSARQSLFVLLRNLLSSVVFTKTISFAFTLSELLILLICAVVIVFACRPDWLGTLFVYNSWSPSPTWWITMILSFLICLFVVETIIDTYSFSAHSMFICFLLDNEMSITHQQLGDYAPFAPNSLKVYMNSAYRLGYLMGAKFKESNKNFNLAYFAAPPTNPVAPASLSPPLSNTQHSATGFAPVQMGTRVGPQPYPPLYYQQQAFPANMNTNAVPQQPLRSPMYPQAAHTVQAPRQLPAENVPLYSQNGNANQHYSKFLP